MPRVGGPRMGVSFLVPDMAYAPDMAYVSCAGHGLSVTSIEQ